MVTKATEEVTLTAVARTEVAVIAKEAAGAEATREEADTETTDAAGAATEVLSHGSGTATERARAAAKKIAAESRGSKKAAVEVARWHQQR